MINRLHRLKQMRQQDRTESSSSCENIDPKKWKKHKAKIDKEYKKRRDELLKRREKQRKLETKEKQAQAKAEEKAKQKSRKELLKKNKNKEYVPIWRRPATESVSKILHEVGEKRLMKKLVEKKAYDRSVFPPRGKLKFASTQTDEQELSEPKKKNKNMPLPETKDNAEKENLENEMKDKPPEIIVEESEDTLPNVPSSTSITSKVSVKNLVQAFESKIQLDQKK
jgi:hypothetical protein